MPKLNGQSARWLQRVTSIFLQTFLWVLRGSCYEVIHSSQRRSVSILSTKITLPVLYYDYAVKQIVRWFCIGEWFCITMKRHYTKIITSHKTIKGQHTSIHVRNTAYSRISACLLPRKSITTDIHTYFISHTLRMISVRIHVHSMTRPLIFTSTLYLTKLTK